MAKPFVNDDLTVHAVGAGRWGLPTDPDALQQPAHVPPTTFDYSGGMFVGVDDADAVPGNLHPARIMRRTDVPPSYMTPHEATHRRYEPPFTVSVNQAGAGFTLIAPPRSGLHYIKVIAAMMTLDAAGTLKFVQGSMDGLSIADLSGAFALGATNGELALQPSDISTPWFYTSPDQGLGIVTVTSPARGFLTCCYSPYEA